MTRGRMFGLALLAPLLVVGGLALAVDVARPWHLVRQLAGARDVYVVAIDPAALRSRAAFLDAEKTLCSTDECDITFYAAGDSVPEETEWLAFQDAVKADPHPPLAAFLNETGDDDRDTQFDCARLPQSDPMDCLPPQRNAPDIVAAAQARGPLGAIGPVRMGMTRDAVVAALGAAAVAAGRMDGKDRGIVKAPAMLGGRRYDGFYSLVGGMLSVVLLRWHGARDPAACRADGARIAAELAPDFGASDGVTFPAIGRSWFRYDWRFRDGASLQIANNIPKSADDCTLSLVFLGKDAPQWLHR
jgi:hypothetical protein